MPAQKGGCAALIHPTAEPGYNEAFPFEKWGRWLISQWIIRAKSSMPVRCIIPLPTRQGDA
jgi:hypothetical protein